MTIRDRTYERLTTALGGPPDLYADLVLRARLDSALAERGLDAEDREFVLRGIEQRLAERGHPLTVLGDAIVDMLKPVPR